MKIAILGGTFNPVHNGHLLLAKQVKEAFAYEKIIFIPSYIPAHKSVAGTIDPKERLHMLKLALEDYSWADYSDCEIERKGISYTHDTLTYISSKYKLKEKPGLIIGDDLAEGFDKWRKPEIILEMADLIIAHRLYENEVVLDFPHKYVDNKIYQLSSSHIREIIHQGKTIEGIVPAKVADYIKKNEFYGKPQRKN